jgi:S1-C subfamily serine protease
MNMNNISTQLLYTTTPIIVENKDNTRTSGTGFIFNYSPPDQENSYIPLIVTNRHVIANAKRGIIQLVTRQGDLPSKDNRVRVEFDADFFNAHVESNTDIAAAPIAPLFHQLEQKGVSLFYRAIDKTIIPTREQVEGLAAIEDITFVGYPSGIFDTYNANPIVRRGITATPVWNNFNNQKSFLIDAGVYPGSSGSPVFILNQGSYTMGSDLAIGTRLMFLGVLTESYTSTSSINNSYYIGLGVVINAEKVQEYLTGLVNKLIRR